MKLVIGYLYPDLMNIYGDTGNIIALKKRAEWRGIKVLIKNISLKDKLKSGDVDVYFFGGGQDQQQELVAGDLKVSDKGRVIREEVKRGVPLLAICGGYQLLGESYQPFESPKLEGVGIFPAFTMAGEERMIGNIVIKISNFKFQISNYLVGFENHSGKTYLKKGAKALGKVKAGFGNNGEDKFEGCIYKNAIGCYMHGSLLPKNPELADWLLQKALEVKYGRKIELDELDDELENIAHRAAASLS
ncbi:MAG: hypothetical protein ACD_30C00051G0001 [uncultured bacterium]|uniref:Lipid II isoglutaminyl synthase (glutamine-hydrolyzing) subunit GatD n=4 Tax=Candidatus Daviesiibacteriota TaxID=1752718 RepID=A0A0G0EQI6_9BACT|nr:MAG: hypothetical protein ACD_30C00051G0001 [uncultured bacterium]KKQ09178.1 MAG: CobB/CobQ domain protein glutamine amidotransferase [Candidatus Daviesbacteria bacterium GW2011_GWB1_36_5]KKQ14776.1 MAG: CobB/CobQ domain protein glutamine amidotransferase [Candidatus Daviesbacteria bacterium GW2011_GWA1_36_8]OGE16412.1 MAG: glutamine amidotransferase [Candidatus Daviesbacteria bacterium RIFCSPHIGHO2_01_FULL_36_37]OGE35339.1 MAG: glutamine amidotransferase [Candidatus Daviesbacteria bacterium